MKKIEIPMVGKGVLKKLYEPAVKHGQPPGTPVYSGEKREGPVRITAIRYTADSCEEQEFGTIEETFGFLEEPAASWINIDGLHEPEIIARIGEQAGLHPLIIEDILHPHQRPKLDDQGGSLMLVARMLRLHPGDQDILSEQVSFVLAKNTLITFQETPGDVFDEVRERIRQKQGRVRKMGADYLLYSLLDAVVDHYFKVIEQLGERIESIELALMEDPYPELLRQIYANKRELLYIRKAIWPLREVVGALERGENPQIKKTDAGLSARSLRSHRPGSRYHRILPRYAQRRAGPLSFKPWK